MVKKETIGRYSPYLLAASEVWFELFAYMASKTSTRFTVNVECCVSTMLKQAFYLIRVFCNGCDLALIVALLQLLKGNLVSLMVRHSQQHQLDFRRYRKCVPKNLGRLHRQKSHYGLLHDGYWPPLHEFLPQGRFPRDVK